MPKTIDRDRKVWVYYNLHRKCYSIQQDGLVLAHAARVWLSDVKPVVRPAGQRKVRATNRKNVHAFLTGHIVAFWPFDRQDDMPPVSPVPGTDDITYNPYKHDTFVTKTSPQRRVERAGEVFLDERGAHARTITYGS